MRYAFVLLLVLFAGCSKPAPKAFTKPEIGMQLFEFQTLCGYDPIDAKRVTNASGETLTLVYDPTTINREPRIGDCAGTFTFVNDKLTSIEH